jgi:hypothetical protein
MEGLASLVAESLERHGFVPRIDHCRLQWSAWRRCEPESTALQAPIKPGLFALAEEVPAESNSEKRTLTILRISQCDDLGIALGRLCLPVAREVGRSSNKKYVRYTVIEEEEQRLETYRALQAWMTSAAEAGRINDMPLSLTVHNFAVAPAEEPLEDVLALAPTGT